MYNEPKEYQDPGNYMMDDRGSNLRRTDKIEALNADHNIGTNYSNKSDIQNSNWLNTSNTDPYRKRTAGSDGKVPKIIKSSN